MNDTSCVCIKEERRGRRLQQGTRIYLFQIEYTVVCECVSMVDCLSLKVHRFYRSSMHATMWSNKRNGVDDAKWWMNIYKFICFIFLLKMYVTLVFFFEHSDEVVRVYVPTKRSKVKEKKDQEPKWIYEVSIPAYWDGGKYSSDWVERTGNRPKSLWTYTQAYAIYLFI